MGTTGGWCVLACPIIARICVGVTCGVCRCFCSDSHVTTKAPRHALRKQSRVKAFLLGLPLQEQGPGAGGVVHVFNISVKRRQHTNAPKNLTRPNTSQYGSASA
jgi:hypothetical protein